MAFEKQLWQQLGGFDESLRLYFNAPILYDRERNGYYYDAKESGCFELPGVWFDAQELHALLRRGGVVGGTSAGAARRATPAGGNVTTVTMNQK